MTSKPAPHTSHIDGTLGEKKGQGVEMGVCGTRRTNDTNKENENIRGLHSILLLSAFFLLVVSAPFSSALLIICPTVSVARARQALCKCLRKGPLPSFFKSHCAPTVMKPLPPPPPPLFQTLQPSFLLCFLFLPISSNISRIPNQSFLLYTERDPPKANIHPLPIIS